MRWEPLPQISFQRHQRELQGPLSLCSWPGLEPSLPSWLCLSSGRPSVVHDNELQGLPGRGLRLAMEPATHTCPNPTGYQKVCCLEKRWENKATWPPRACFSQVAHLRAFTSGRSWVQLLSSEVKSYMDFLTPRYHRLAALNVISSPTIMFYLALWD